MRPYSNSQIQPGFPRPFLKTPAGIGVCLVAIALGAYLLLAHSPHLGRYLPFLFLAACPLMHVFMMRGMHDHGGHGAPAREGAGEHDHAAMLARSQPEASQPAGHNHG